MPARTIWPPLGFRNERHMRDTIAEQCCIDVIGSGEEHRPCCPSFLGTNIVEQHNDEGNALLSMGLQLDRTVAYGLPRTSTNRRSMSANLTTMNRVDDTYIFRIRAYLFHFGDNTAVRRLDSKVGRLEAANTARG
jgi:hypothetical protein